MTQHVVGDTPTENVDPSSTIARHRAILKSYPLGDYICRACEREFAYGTFDCALFAADWVLEATGIDYAAELRGYTSRREAYRIIASFGSLEAMLTQLLGRGPIEPELSSPGDVVLASVPVAAGEIGEAIGIRVGVLSAFPGALGVVFYPTSRARLAWRI